MDDGTFTLTKKAFNTRHYSSLTGLLFLILDHVLTFKREYNHVWRAQIGIRVQLFYLSARYLALSAETAHYILLHVFLSHSPIPPSVCEAWFFLLFITLSLLVFILDTVLFLRVLALYERNYKVFLLWIPILLPFGIGLCLLVRNTRRPDSFDLQCDLRRIPAESPFLSASFIFSHGSLCAATFVKRNIARGRAVVVRLVVHEGAWTFVLLCAVVGGVLPYTFASRSSNPSVIFIWPMTLISIATCRLIMSMRLLATEPPATRHTAADADTDDDFRLTTFIESISPHDQADPLCLRGPSEPEPRALDQCAQHHPRVQPPPRLHCSQAVSGL